MGEPEIEVFGKPTLSTFDYARGLLERSKAAGSPGGGVTGGRKLERIYMVGGEREGALYVITAAVPR